MKEHKGWNSRGYLPHFDSGDTCQFVTFRLADSLPVSKIEQWKNESDLQCRRLCEEFLDSGFGQCELKNPDSAEIVENAILYFEGVRYDLAAWVVMPNHVHVLFGVRYGFSLSQILHSWKSFTANEISRKTSRRSSFWQEDYFDRFIRNEKHFHSAVEYIENNPVKAGLCRRPEDWRFSSAFRPLGARASCPHFANELNDGS